MNKKFAKRDMQDMAYDDSEKLTQVSNEIAETNRWSIIYDVVFRDNETGKHYASEYSVGATEQQDECAYEHEGDEITCIEVEEVEVTVKKWMGIDVK